MTVSSLPRKLLKLVIPLTLCFLVILVRQGGLLQEYELGLIDRFFQWKPSEPVDVRVAMVGITEADIGKLQVSRLSDLYLTGLIEAIESGNPVAVGLDIFRDHPVPPSYQELLQLEREGKEIFENPLAPPGCREFLDLFKKYGNLFGIGLFHGQPQDSDFSAIASPDVPEQQVTGAGTPIDDDYVKRRSYLWDTVRDGGIYNLAFALAEKYLRFKGFEWKPYRETIWSQHGNLLRKFGLRESFFGEPGLIYRNGERRIIIRYFSGWDGPYAGAADGGFQIINNWRKAGFELYPISEVMGGKVPPDVFRDRIVLIGAYSPSLKDMLPTPINKEQRRMHGIEMLAQTISQILSAVLDDRPLIRTWREPWISLWTVGLGLASYHAMAAFHRRYWWLGIASMVAMTIIWLALGYFYFLKGVWISVVPSILTLWLLGISGLIYKYETGRRKDYFRIKNSLTRQQIYKELTVYFQQNSPSLLNSLQFLYNYAQLAEELVADLLDELEEVRDESLRFNSMVKLNKLNIFLGEHEEKVDRVCLFLIKVLPEAKNLLPLSSRSINKKVVQSLSYFQNALGAMKGLLLSDYGVIVEQVVVIRATGVLYLGESRLSYLSLTLFRTVNDMISSLYEREVTEFTILIYGEQKNDVYEIIIEPVQEYQAKDLVIVLCEEESKKWGAKILYSQGKWKISFINV